MKNLEPRIMRQRLIVEGKYTIKINEKVIRKYLIELAKTIRMRPLIKPLVFSPNRIKHPIHHGIAGFIGWVSSGGSIYTWDKFNFFTTDIYTCKSISVSNAIKFTKKFFKTTKIEYQEIKCYQKDSCSFVQAY